MKWSVSEVAVLVHVSQQNFNELRQIFILIQTQDFFGTHPHRGFSIRHLEHINCGQLFLSHVSRFLIDLSRLLRSF